MSKINFSTELLDMDGKPIEDISKRKLDEVTGKVLKEGPTLRLADICINVLTGAKTDQDKKDLDGEAKLHFFVLACQIRDSLKPGAAQPDIRAKDIILLKEMISLNYIPLVSGQAWQMLEPEPPEPVAKEEEQ